MTDTTNLPAFRTAEGQPLPRCPRCKAVALVRYAMPGWVVTCPRPACTAKTSSSPSRERAIAEFVQPATRWSTR